MFHRVDVLLLIHSSLNCKANRAFKNVGTVHEGVGLNSTSDIPLLWVSSLQVDKTGFYLCSSGQCVNFQSPILLPQLVKCEVSGSWSSTCIYRRAFSRR